VHPEDKAFVRQVIERAAREGKDFDIDHRLLMPDQSIKYLHITARRRSDDSGALEFIGAVRDVTAAKIAQQKLRQDEAELRQLIDFVPEHVLVMDAHGRRLYENQAMREYFGTSLENIQAKDFYKKFVHPEDVASGAFEERERAVSRGVVWEGELRLRRKDGEYRWFLIRCNPLSDEKGNILRRYATATDIEDRKRAEERVRKENVALREEVDKASMFEEIVGSSAALKAVLTRVSQVAPSDASRASYRRNRHRKRTHRSCDPQAVSALRKSFCYGELRSHTPDPNRLGTVWTREGSIYRCPAAAYGAI
jgi:formate hydrogenlyase transcriptional activator